MIAFEEYNSSAERGPSHRVVTIIFSGLTANPEEGNPSQFSCPLALLDEPALTSVMVTARGRRLEGDLLNHLAVADIVTPHSVVVEDKKAESWLEHGK